MRILPQTVVFGLRFRIYLIESNLNIVKPVLSAKMYWGSSRLRETSVRRHAKTKIQTVLPACDISW